MLSPSEVVPYDSGWPAAFEALRDRLAEVLEPVWFLEHVGSTSVPGLSAKPIIDIDLVVPAASAIPDAIKRLAERGYRHQGNLGIEGREAFEAPPGGPEHHLYLVVEGTTPHRDHIDLRDYLRRSPDAVARYSARKLELAPLLLVDREAYGAGKTPLIAELLDTARQELCKSGPCGQPHLRHRDVEQDTEDHADTDPDASEADPANELTE